MAKTPNSQCSRPGFDSWSGSQIPQATTKTPCSQINKYILKKKKKRNEAQEEWLVCALTLGQWNTRGLTPHFPSFFIPSMTMPLPLGSSGICARHFTCDISFYLHHSELSSHSSYYETEAKVTQQTQDLNLWPSDPKYMSPSPITSSISDLPKG